MGSIEDLEAKNSPQDLYLPPKKRKIYQEPRSQPNLVEEETGKTTTTTSGGNRSHRNRPVEDLQPKNGLQGHELPFKKRKIYQEPRSINPNQMEEEKQKLTTGTTGGGVQTCDELMRALMQGQGIINRAVLVLRKKLSEADVNPNQNRLQHSEEEVEQLLFEMMTSEEKQLATWEGVRDGLRVSVLDRLGRVYHLNLKKIHGIKKYYRFRGPEYRQFVKDNHLKAGDILETWAVRVKRRGGGDEGDGGGIMEGELLLAMLNYDDDFDSYKESYDKEVEMLTPSEKEVLDALLLLQEKLVMF